MKRNLIFSIGLISVISGGAVIAREVPGACSYDEATGYFIDNGGLHAKGTWIHAKNCALEGRLPASVIERLGAWGDKATRLEADSLRKENLRISLLRKNNIMKRTSALDDVRVEARLSPKPVLETTQRSGMEFGSNREKSSDWEK